MDLCLLRSFILLSLFASFNCKTGEVTITPNTHTTRIGDSVQFFCTVKNRKQKFSVVWKHGEEMISERCSAFEKEKYEVECSPNDWEVATEFRIKIKNAVWSDRGTYTCLHMLELETANLTITKLPELKQTKFEVIKKNDKPTAAASMEEGSGTLSRVSPQTISGAGKKNNPFNLRGGESIDIHCETKCSYPSVKISWSRNNISIDPNVNEGNTVRIIPLSHVETDKKCKEKENSGMFVTTSVARVNCSKPQLIGLNKIQCYPESYDENMDFDARQSVFILCPDRITTPITPNREINGKGGERPMRLTSGEVVGIAVGTAIFLILMFIGCMTLNKKNKNNEQGLIRGMRV